MMKRIRANLTNHSRTALCLLCITGILPLSCYADQKNSHELTLTAPITTWDEAIPLGNGMLGGLLWGQDNTINLSLDRGDLWEENISPEITKGNWNYADMQKLIKEQNWDEYRRKYEGVCGSNSTKVPGGRLVLTLDPGKKADSFILDMKVATGAVVFTDGGKLECFFHADKRVAMIKIDDTRVTSRFIRPDGLDKLHYKPAEFGQQEDMQWMVQEAGQGLVYTVLTASKQVGKQTLIAVAITTNREDPGQTDPLALAKQRASNVLNIGFDKAFKEHKTWWENFWLISEVNIPDVRIQHHYNLVKYFYGAASRPDAPSIPLQGVWTQDSGDLPPWCGDYHHDLNTEMTYIAYHTAGLTDSGLSYINHLWNLKPEFQKYARYFFGIDGLAVPGVMSLNGKPMSGWQQYGLSPIYSIWISQSFYRHWKCTMDQDFLRERAYPWMNQIVSTIVKLMHEENGKLYLPLSTSAEIFDNTPRAYLKPNSNQDLSMLHWAFAVMAEMSASLGKADEMQKWNTLRGKLDDLHIDPNNVLMYSENEPFNVSHRHHSMAMAIHPFGTLNIDGSDRDRQIIAATLKKVDAIGTWMWTGYSFPWFGSLLARAGQSDLAYQYLTYYERAFCLRNGFHVNGDQIGTGLSFFDYRPFTMEGNFLAMETVHDMILQSWPVNIAKDPTPVIRLFPAMPWKWHDAGFKNLNAEGGFIVSAQRANNATTCFEIKATRDGMLRLRDNFGGVIPNFNHKVTKDGRDFVITLKKGQILSGKLAKPAGLPPEPEESIEAAKRIQRIDELAAKKK